MKKWRKIFATSFILLLCIFTLSGKPVLAASDKATFCDDAGYPVEEPDVSNLRVYTALGCIPAEMNKLMEEWLLPYVFGIAGGIAFLLMIFGFIKMSTAKGDPKAVQGAKETIGSALTGLLVSVFSLFILRLLAVDILHIPGIN